MGFVLLTFLMICAVYSVEANESGIFDITRYGAKVDGKTVNTEAIQKALDACEARGGGIVSVPPGIFVSGTLYLKDHTELRLERGAVLKASPNRKDYCSLDAYPQNGESFHEGWSGGHLIVAVGKSDIALSGPGLIDGSADLFLGEPRFTEGAIGWRHGFANTKDKYNGPEEEKIRASLRPGQLIVFCESRDIRISDISIKNSPCWCCFLHGCEDVFISGVKIDNPPYFANSDGIDIDSCSRVIVSDCRILTGDDAFAVRGNPRRLTDKNRVCEHIVINNCVVSSASSVFRIGVGDGTIHDVLISNIDIIEGGTGLHFQSSYSARAPKGVNISRVRCSNISMRNVGWAIKITPGTKTATAKIEDLFFDGIYAETFLGVNISANENTAPERITFRNSNFVAAENPIKMKIFPDTFLDIGGGKNTVLENVSVRFVNPNWKKTIPDSLKDQSFRIINCNFPDPSNK